MPRKYSIILADSEAGLYALAKHKNFHIRGKTVRKFDRLVSNDDHNLGNIGEIDVDRPGWIAIGWREV